ncbi:MAG: hypothetical protein F6J92_03475 [Symploca sp. SIO1A3]|nr:hypothetical protein [Symploca sp. SIO1A3]
MNPIELLGKYQWSYKTLSNVFGVSELEARRWGFRKEAKTRRNPSATAQILAVVISKHPEVISTIQAFSQEF